MKRSLFTLATAIAVLSSAAACGQQPQKNKNAEATEQTVVPVAEPTAEQSAASLPAEGVTNETEKGDDAAASAVEQSEQAPDEAVQDKATVE